MKVECRQKRCKNNNDGSCIKKKIIIEKTEESCQAVVICLDFEEKEKENE